MEAAVHETGQIPDVKTLADRLAIYDVLVRQQAPCAARGTRPIRCIRTSTAERVV